ncbi:MAG: 50S ribosomal protein L4 [Aigarchaeota archaeon]|nr:50S ribosomal protein L4 [Candidatus Wolframiiraptor gerlachensis]
MSLLVELLMNASRVGERRVPVLDLAGNRVSEITLPKTFLAPLREDLVWRAFIHLQTHVLQPKGTFKGSGHKYSVESLGAGYGVARVSRIRAHGTGKAMAGGMINSAVGGRPGHPPVPEKKIHKDLNEKEKRAALAVAIAFTADREAVKARGHKIPEDLPLPIVVDDALQSIAKTRGVREFLEKIGLGEELKRCSKKKVRAGKGKRRGRRYKRRVGPLIVILEDRGIEEAAENIPGVEVVKLKDLSVLHLAPGAKPGRLTIWTRSALEKLDERILGGLA